MMQRIIIFSFNFKQALKTNLRFAKNILVSLFFGIGVKYNINVI